MFKLKPAVFCPYIQNLQEFSTLSFKPLVRGPYFPSNHPLKNHFGWCLFVPKDSIDARLPRFSSWRWVPDNGPNGFGGPGLGTGRCGGASEMARLWVLGEAIWSDLGDLYPYLGKRWVCPLIFQSSQGFRWGLQHRFFSGWGPSPSHISKRFHPLP